MGPKDPFLDVHDSIPTILCNIVIVSKAQGTYTVKYLDLYGFLYSKVEIIPPVTSTWPFFLKENGPTFSFLRDRFVISTWLCTKYIDFSFILQSGIDYDFWGFSRGHSPLMPQQKKARNHFSLMARLGLLIFSPKPFILKSGIDSYPGSLTIRISFERALLQVELW